MGKQQLECCDTVCWSNLICEEPWIDPVGDLYKPSISLMTNPFDTLMQILFTEEWKLASLEKHLRRI